MKKILFIIGIACMVLGCHKKETARLSNHLEGYLEKAQNNTLSVEQRISFNNKALELILQSENKTDSLFFNQLFKVAGIYYNIKELEAYKTTSEHIMTYAKQVKDTSNLAKAYEYIGDYYKEQSLKDSAYCYYLKAEKQYILVSDKENTGKMLFNKASTQYNDGDLARSERSCLEALHHFNNVKGKNQRDIYDLYNLLGMLANDQQEYLKALEYHNKALQIILKDSNISNRATLKSATLNNLGVVYRNKNENKQALSYFIMALEDKDLFEKFPFIYATLLDNTAYSHFKLKDDTEVEDLFYKALRIRESLNIVPGIVMSKLHMSEYYHEQKDNEKAFAFADEAYKTAKTKGTDPRNVMLTLQQLQVVNPPLKEIYATEYNHIADSLQRATPKIHETITQELAQAEAKEEAKAKKKEKIKTVLVELGVIVCFIGVNYVINQREKRRVRRSEEQSAKKQAELKDQIKIYDLALKQKNNDTGNHCFVDILHNLLNEQKKHITINEYIDEGITWDDVDHAIMIQLYHVLEGCFEVINQNEQVKVLNLEIFQGEETKAIVILNISYNSILNPFELKQPIGGNIIINHKEGNVTKIEITLGVA